MSPRLAIATVTVFVSRSLASILIMRSPYAMVCTLLSFLSKGLIEVDIILIPIS